jgi:hypothetical protein
MTQHQINAAFMRSLKTSYKYLTPTEKRLVKLQERHDQNDKSVSRLCLFNYQQYGENWRKDQRAKVDFELMLSLLADNMKISESISRLENKTGLDADEVMGKHTEYNRMRSYGGSY